MATELRETHLHKVCYAVILAVLLLSSAAAQPYAGRIGVEITDQPTAFVDVAKVLRQFQLASNEAPAPMDASGWPTTDAYTVLFDYRAVPAWAPPIDDPVAFQPDMSGTYKLSFNGQATVTFRDTTAGATLSNQIYDVATNTTSADLTIPSGTPNLIVLNFSSTVRTPGAGTNTGITNLKCIRPAYPSSQIFATEFLNALAPFSHMRFMGWLDTNYDAGDYGDPGHHIIEWADRALPTDAWMGGDSVLRPGAHGVPWEYVILLANQVNKDIWINIPVSASGAQPTDTASYIYQLALLLKNGNAFTGNHGLNSNLNIYIEHSNEVWNPGFSQFAWNKLAAEDEVNQGGSILNQGGGTADDWAKRRHARRVYEIGQIFAAVFGPGSLNTRVRPVYAHWTIFPAGYDGILTWMQTNYGDPKNYFYGIAQTAYFNDQTISSLPSSSASVADVLAAMRTDSDNGKTYAVQIDAVAKKWGLKHLVYEGGPDDGGGSTTDIANRIRANRDPGMGALLLHHISDNWFATGGDMFTYFVLSSAYSRYGCWGATEDYRIPVTPKFQALYTLTGYDFIAMPPEPAALTATVSGRQVALSWGASAGATGYSVQRGTTSGGPYTVLATLTTPGYTDTSAMPGVIHYYIVTASVSGIDSLASNEVSAQAGPPRRVSPHPVQPRRAPAR